MEWENQDIDEIPVIIDIRSYIFEHLVLNNNEENTSTSSEEKEPEADSTCNSELRLNGTIWYD